MARTADDILVGGGRVFLNNMDIGWLQGEMGLEEQGNALAIKESEGATVVSINLDKEVHFTFNLLEANLDTLRMLNPSYTSIIYGENDIAVTNEYIADLGKLNGLKNIPIAEAVAIKVVPATVLRSANATGDTSVIVENPRKFAAGDTVQIIQGSHIENGTVAAVDSASGTITLESDILNAFPAGAMLKNTTSSKAYKLGDDYNFYPVLGLITRAAVSTNLLSGDGAAVDYTYHSAQGRGYGMGSFEDGTTYKLEFWHKKRSGKYRCIRMFKARVSGNFTPFSINQDNESPLAMDVTLMADESIADTRRNIYEQIDYEASAAPNGGW